MSYSDFITTVGVGVTGFFTWLVWKATKETARATQAAADTAKATLKLNEDLAKREELREKEFIGLMKSQLSPIILRESELALNAIVDIDPMSIKRKLENAPKELSVDKIEIAKYFSPKEVETISKTWRSYEEYRTKYFKKYYHGGEERDLLIYSSSVVLAFNNLINMLKYPDQYI